MALFIGGLFFLLLLLIGLLNIPAVQTALAQKIVSAFSRKLGTTVSVQKLNIKWLNKASLQQFYLEDTYGDTLIYAGELDVRITDWFFFKKEPVLTYLGLNDAKVFLNRHKDTDQWNYQFIVDALGSNEKKESNKKSTFQLDLNTIEMSRVAFYHNDAWVGTNIGGTLKEFQLKANKIDFKEKTINLQKIYIDGADFGVLEYAAGRPPRPTNHHPYLLDTTAFNTHNWRVNLEKLEIKNNRFYLEYPEKPAAIAQYFDHNHLDINNIAISAKDLKIEKDTITAQLNHLQATERSGLAIQKMKANITVSPVLSECKNLYLETNQSVLKGYYAMIYNRFPDFLDFENKVNMQADLNTSLVSFYDIAYFAPELRQLGDLRLEFTGKGGGVLKNLIANNVKLKDGNSTLIGNVQITGLPNTDETIFNLKNLDVYTDGFSLSQYIPAIKQQKAVDIEALRFVNFKGDLTGHWTNFNAIGNLTTNLGLVEADLNLKLPSNALAEYSGRLATKHFDIGRLLMQNDVKTISFNAQVDGKGFQPEEADFLVNGVVQQLNLWNYDYQNISVNGTFKKHLFEGLLKANDPSLRLNFDGKIDYSHDQPIYDFLANVDYINAKDLGWTAANIEGAADLKLNFKGKNIDDFDGKAGIYNIHLQKDFKKLNLDSLVLRSGKNESGENQLELNSNELYAIVYGNYNLKLLPPSFQLFLSYYLPTYIQYPENYDLNQNIHFEVWANKASNDLISLFNDHIQIEDETLIIGNLDLPNHDFKLVGNLPKLDVYGVSSEDVKLNVKGDFSALSVSLDAQSLQSGNYNLVNDFQFSGQMFRDSVQFKLLTSSKDNNMDHAVLNGTAYTDEGNFYLKFLNSELLLNNTHWNIREGNKIEFAKDGLTIDNLSITSRNQSININPPYNNYGKDNAFVAINNFNLEQINAFLPFVGLEFGGLMDGSIRLRSLAKEPTIDFNLQSNRFLINADTVGEFHAIGQYDWKDKVLSFNKASRIYQQDASLFFPMRLAFVDSTQQGISGEIQLNKVPVKWAQPFLKDMVHGISGTADGVIQLAGNFKDFRPSGVVDFKDVGVTIDVTGVPYSIPKAQVNLDASNFMFHDIAFYDSNGNIGQLNGNISHHQLSNFLFNIRLQSENMQVVNLKAQKNSRYYGNVNANFQAQINGLFENMNMTVFGRPSTSSVLIIPVIYDTDLGKYNYINFKEDTKEDTAQVVISRPGYQFNFRLDAVATPDLETILILDETTDEKIVATGNGNVILEIPSEGDIKMNGNYIINQGTYDFTFQQFQVLNYKRRFIINPNSVIKWNGSLTDADLDVSAYASVKTRLYDLIQSDMDRLSLSPQEVKDAQIPQNIRVSMKMKGLLSQPEMKFKIDLEEGRSIGTYAYQRLQRINSDDKELVNQVAALLLLDKFMPPDGLNNTAFASGTINNMTELFSSVLSSQITNFANSMLGINDLSVDVKYKNYTLGASDDPLVPVNYFNRNEAGVNLKKNFLNNRLIVEVGGVYDWGRTAQSANFQDNLAGDFRIQYLLTKTGNLRFDVFRTSNFDALSLQNIGRQGVGINFRKSFNNIADLLNIKKNKKSSDSITAPSKFLPPKQEEMDSLNSEKRREEEMEL